MNKSAWPDTEWASFAWMLELRDMLVRARPFLYEVKVSRTAHEQDRADADELEARIRAVFPHPWEKA